MRQIPIIFKAPFITFLIILFIVRSEICAGYCTKRNALLPLLRLSQPTRSLSNRAAKNHLLHFPSVFLDDEDFMFPAMIGFPKSESNVSAFSLNLVEKENEFQVLAGRKLILIKHRK
jgi:hypothetical protein